MQRGSVPSLLCISIHALLAESDSFSSSYGSAPALFLSTLSLRRATIYGYEYNRQVVHFYPRSPCGERLFQCNRRLHCKKISIHALLAESDARRLSQPALSSKFLSTLSLRRATEQAADGRLSSAFLSTLSLRRATVSGLAKCALRDISIHALLAESDFFAVVVVNGIAVFLSTLSLRRATWQGLLLIIAV